MHRTTISLDEAIYRRVAQLAKRRGRSLARTIEDLLRSSLGGRPAASVRAPLHRGNGPLPGVDIADRDRLYDLMERDGDGVMMDRAASRRGRRGGV